MSSQPIHEIKKHGEKGNNNSADNDEPGLTSDDSLQNALSDATSGGGTATAAATIPLLQSPTMNRSAPTAATPFIHPSADWDSSDDEDDSEHDTTTAMTPSSPFSPAAAYLSHLRTKRNAPSSLVSDGGGGGDDNYPHHADTVQTILPIDSTHTQGSLSSSSSDLMAKMVSAAMLPFTSSVASSSSANAVPPSPLSMQSSSMEEPQHRNARRQQLSPLSTDHISSTQHHHHALTFCLEHRIFLRAALDLLHTRDQQAPELGMLDPIVLRAGPLKKASHVMNGVWKVKYVEIRRGMFSYYENKKSNTATLVTTATTASGHEDTAATTTSATATSSTTTGERQLSLSFTTTMPGPGHAGGDALTTMIPRRKNVPLSAHTTTCRAVKLHQKALAMAPGGAIFELNVHGVKRLWMAQSRPERQAWIQAIHDATVGGSVTTSNVVGDDNDEGAVVAVRDNAGAGTANAITHNADASATTTTTNTTEAAAGSDALTAAADEGVTETNVAPSNHAKPHVGSSPRAKFKTELKLYVKTQHVLRHAKSRHDYVSGLQDLVDRPFVVPVKWICSSAAVNYKHQQDVNHGTFAEESVHRSVEQLWRDLQRDTVRINGVTLAGDAGHGPEAIVGALLRQILATSKTSDGGGRRPDMTESQALVYARDILLAGNRTRSGGDSYFCVNTLCRNDDLVVITPDNRSAVEPVMIVVEPGEQPNTKTWLEKSGWIKTRNKLQRSWKKFFFVLSEGTLSYYESALPRPHRLRGQLVLVDAAISVIRKQVPPATEDGKPSVLYVLSIVSKDSTLKERFLLFESEDRLLDWTYALECTARANHKTVPDPTSSARKLHHRRRASESSVAGTNMAEQATKEHAAGLGFDVGVIDERLAMYARKAAVTVRVSIQASTTYKVCTVDPQGEAEDTWATIDAQFLQNFRVAGGQHGKIIRGEEVVRVHVRDCLSATVDAPDRDDDNVSPTRRRKNSLMFRSFSSAQSADEPHTSAAKIEMEP